MRHAASAEPAVPCAMRPCADAAWHGVSGTGGTPSCTAAAPPPPSCCVAWEARWRSPPHRPLPPPRLPRSMRRSVCATAVAAGGRTPAQRR
eukprot:364841-Chlamydomonas_euryale.AAC.5